MSSWLYSLLSYLQKMGCVLLKPTLYVEGQKYRVKRQLGEGGFSTVDLAENTSTGKLVAVKRITCHSIQDQNLARLEIEVHTMFKHENIIRLIGKYRKNSVFISRLKNRRILFLGDNQMNTVNLTSLHV